MTTEPSDRRKSSSLFAPNYNTYFADIPHSLSNPSLESQRLGLERGGSRFFRTESTGQFSIGTSSTPKTSKDEQGWRINWEDARETRRSWNYVDKFLFFFSFLCLSFQRHVISVISDSAEFSRAGSGKPSSYRFRLLDSSSYFITLIDRASPRFSRLSF